MVSAENRHLQNAAARRQKQERFFAEEAQRHGNRFSRKDAKEAKFFNHGWTRMDTDCLEEKIQHSTSNTQHSMNART